MRIWYTNKLIFWSNEGADYLEQNKFNEYLNDWRELSNVKSINWTDHYSANFYATDNFEATYFKIVKGGREYYFFIQDIQNDSANGKFYYLKLDFYNTYTINFIEQLKLNNPQVTFNRKHSNRLSSDKTNIDYLQENNYLLNVPSYLSKYSNLKTPIKRDEMVRKLFFDKPSVTTIKNKRPENGNYFIHIASEDYLWNNKFYTYLKVKRPPNGVEFLNLKELQIAESYYIPIEWSHDLGAPTYNSWGALQNFPSDYVIGVVISSISADLFVGGLSVKELFEEVKDSNGQQFPFFKDCLAYALPAGYQKSNFKFSLDVGARQYFEGVYKKWSQVPYNIDYYKAEPMLYNSTFYDIKINSDINIDIPSIMNDIINCDFANGKPFENVTFETLIGGDILIRVKPSNKIMSNNYEPLQYGPISYALPFSGDTYNSYLLSNINSINTGISLAKEQAKIAKSQAITNGVFSMFFGGLGGAASAAGGDVGGAIGQFGGALSGLTNSIFAGVKADFSVKSTIAKYDAQKADVANKPDTLLDSYGQGISCFHSNLFGVVHNCIPENTQKLVFSDIYFNGYIVNTVEPFNNYDNRISFNYFELGNAYQLATQYLKYPKRVLEDIALQVQKGIRIWKTSSFDYTMKTDNREKDYA